MARAPQPHYVVAFSPDAPTVEALRNTGDLAKMQSVLEKSEAWAKDPANAKDPHLAEERQQIQELKAAIADLKRTQPSES